MGHYRLLPSVHDGLVTIPLIYWVAAWYWVPSFWGMVFLGICYFFYRAPDQASSGPNGRSR